MHEIGYSFPELPGKKTSTSLIVENNEYYLKIILCNFATRARRYDCQLHKCTRRTMKNVENVHYCQFINKLSFFRVYIAAHFILAR